MMIGIDTKVCELQLCNLLLILVARSSDMRNELFCALKIYKVDLSAG